MKAGMMNIAGGNIFSKEMKKAFSISHIYMSALQKPIAKLLYHKTMKGKGHRSLLKVAANIRETIRKFEIEADKSTRRKLAVLSFIDDARRFER